MTTTTFPYTYTTFTNTSPTPFTTPSAAPSVFPWGPVPSFACSAPSSAPSDAPLALPSNTAGSCAISNVENVNTHAFWDMYECCKSGKISTVGTPLPCSAVCYTDDEQSFLELGECLSKRVKMVVCSPPEGQRGEAKSEDSSSATKSTGGSSSTAASKTAEVSRITGTSSPTPTPTPTQASSKASKLAGQGAVSKAGLIAFGVLAITSVVGVLV
ncbi:hypothetical protein yc1106_04305 [Curvularia clavata]|uniref:Uncharacterized protein n=1 Tax=Curvularia clavata TaxID=95742 RepID=A0A9Q9DT32_CURCL|nr:hypothetical protein yc1106_04305 [Curvularia clavata]